MAREEVATLVADSVSGMCRAGFADDDALPAVFPLIVGGYKSPDIMFGMDPEDSYDGDEVQSKRGVSTVKHHIQHAGNGNAACVELDIRPNSLRSLVLPYTVSLEKGGLNPGSAD